MNLERLDRSLCKKQLKIEQCEVPCTDMSPLILAAILATTFAQQNGYYHQEYNYRTSSSSFKNNELQHRNDDEGYYSRDGDLQGRVRPKVNSHSQHSEYLNPKLRNGYRMGADQTASFGQLHAQDRFRMGENEMGGFGYGPTQRHHYGMASELREVTASLQEEMQRELQRAVFDQHQRAEAYGSITQAQIEADRRLLEEELRRNLTMRMQEALKMHYGNQGIRGAFSYSIVNGRLQPAANYDNRELEDLTRQMEMELLRHLEQQVQRQYHTRVDTAVHTTRNTYRVNEMDNYPSAMEQRPVYQPYPPPVMRPTHPVAPIPDSITTVATRVQTELNEILNKILEDTQRRYFNENSYHANVNYDHILAQLQEELRANITFHFDDQIKRAYGYTNYASKYSVEDIENLRRQIEANLVTKLNRDFNRQREQYLQTHMYVVQPMQQIPARVHPIPSIHPMPTNLRPMPNIYYPVNNGQYNQEAAEMQQRLHEQLSRQLQMALMQQSYRQAHMYTGSGFNPQANYESTLNQLTAELNRNLTRQMELLNAEQYQSGLHTAQLANMRNQLQQDLTRQLQQGLQQSYSRYSSWSSSSSSSSTGGSYRPVRGFAYGVNGGSVDTMGEDCMMGDDPTAHKRRTRDLTQQTVDDDDLTQQVQTNDDLTQQVQTHDDLTQQVQTHDDLTQQSQDLTQQTQDDDNLTQQVQTNDDLTQQVQTQNDDLTQQIQQSNDFLGNERQTFAYSPRPVYSNGHQGGTTRQLPQNQVQTHDALTQQVQTQDDDLTQQVQTHDDLTQRPQTHDDLTQQVQTLDDLPRQSQDLTQQVQDFAPGPVHYTPRPVYAEIDGHQVPVGTTRGLPQNQQVQTHDALTQQVQNDDLTQQSQDLTQQVQTQQAYGPFNYKPQPVYSSIYGQQVQVGTTRDLPQNQRVQTHDALTQQVQNDDLTQQTLSDDLTQQTLNDDLTQQVQPVQTQYQQRPIYWRPYQSQQTYPSQVVDQTQQTQRRYEPQLTQQTEIVEPPYQRQRTYASGSPNYQSYPSQRTYTSTYDWRPQTSVGQRVQYYENLQRPRYQPTPKPSYSRYPLVQQQSQDLTQQTQDLTQQPQDLTQQTQDLTQQTYQPKVVYIPIVREREPLQSQDVTQQTQQNQLWTPQSQQSQYLTPQSQPAQNQLWTQQNQYLTPQSQDLTQQTQDLTQQTQDLTQQTQDLTQQSQDEFAPLQLGKDLPPSYEPGQVETLDVPNQNPLTQQAQLFTNQQPESKDLTQQTEDLTQQSQDLDEPIEPQISTNQIFQDSQQPRGLTAESQDLTQQTQDLTQQTEDLTQQTQDLTQQPQDLTQQSQDLTQQAEDLTQQTVELTTLPQKPSTNPSDQRLTEAQRESQRLIDLLKNHQHETQQTQEDEGYGPKGRSLVPNYHQVEVAEPEVVETARDIEPIEPQVADTVQQVDADETATTVGAADPEATTKKPGWWSRLGSSIKNKLG